MSFFASGEAGVAGVVELEPLLDGDELPVEDGDEEGVLDVVPPLLLGALSQAARARAAAAAISRALVIPGPFGGLGGRQCDPAKMTCPPSRTRVDLVTVG